MEWFQTEVSVGNFKSNSDSEGKHCVQREKESNHNRWQALPLRGWRPFCDYLLIICTHLCRPRGCLVSFPLPLSLASVPVQRDQEPVLQRWAGKRARKRRRKTPPPSLSTTEFDSSVIFPVERARWGSSQGMASFLSDYHLPKKPSTEREMALRHGAWQADFAPSP